MFVAADWLILKGGEPVGPHLALLDQFFIGYQFCRKPNRFRLWVCNGLIAGYIVAALQLARGEKRDEARGIVLPESVDRPTCTGERRSRR